MGNLYRFLNLGSFIALLLGGGGRGQRHPRLYQTEAAHRRRAAQPRRHCPPDLPDLPDPSRGDGPLSAHSPGLCSGLGCSTCFRGVLADVLPLEVDPSFDPFALLEGLGLGLGLSLLFAALPLLAIRKTSPLLTLRASFEEAKPADSGPLRWVFYLGIASGHRPLRLSPHWPLAPRPRLCQRGRLGLRAPRSRRPGDHLWRPAFLPLFLELYLAPGLGQPLPAQQPDRDADVGPGLGDLPAQHPLSGPDQPAGTHRKRRLRRSSPTSCSSISRATSARS